MGASGHGGVYVERESLYDSLIAVGRKIISPIRNMFKDDKSRKILSSFYGVQVYPAQPEPKTDDVEEVNKRRVRYLEKLIGEKNGFDLVIREENHTAYFCDNGGERFAIVDNTDKQKVYIPVNINHDIRYGLETIY